MLYGTVTKKILAAILAMSCFFTGLQADDGFKGDTADYVVVGVGTAGGLMVKRLSDNHNTSVIGLHDGKNYTQSFIIKYSKNTPFTVFSGLFAGPFPIDINSLNLPVEIKGFLERILQLSGGLADLLYQSGVTIPQPDADNRSLLWIEALPLGGASSINAGAWCRGTDQVYAQWEQIAGPKWSVERILGIYKSLEKYKGKTLNRKARGYNGPIKVLQDNPISKLSEVFTEAVIKATGFPFVLDYNDPKTPIGVSPQMQLTHSGHDGFYRVNSATAFLNKKVMNSKGQGVNGRRLKIYFESTALKIIWNGNKAIGVEYLQDGIVKQVYAKKGVVVCAGLQSSAFLLHSGVGPSGLLSSLDIPVIYDNPNVGQGLADQPHVVTIFTSNPNDSVAGSNHVFSQISWLPAPGNTALIRQPRFTTVDLIPGITLGLVDLCQPLSRGSVSINSANPLSPPVIDLGVLSNSTDLDNFISAFQVYIKNINNELQLIDPLYELIFPPPEIIDDTALLTDFIRDEIGSNMHFQSHCRMAPLSQGGVVDSDGRVYGVVNVIVADNSIVPLCMDGSPMASAFLIAANIAQILLGY